MILSLSLLFNVIQFCAAAFAYYSQATAAQEIFGHTLQSLHGIGTLFVYIHATVQDAEMLTPVCYLQVQRVSNRFHCSSWIDICLLCCVWLEGKEAFRKNPAFLVNLKF